jgi:uncharacterized damage-inducible protein DinB
MFREVQFKVLFAYHWHVTDRLLAAAARLASPDYRANPGYGHGSVHDLLFHLLRTDQAWRLGLETGQQPAPLPAEEYPDLAALQAGFAAEQHAWNALLEGLTGEQIEGDLQVTDRRGRQHALPTWRILQHLILHGVQHQAEIAQLLAARGQSPGDLDFIFYRPGG